MRRIPCALLSMLVGVTLASLIGCGSDEESAEETNGERPIRGFFGSQEDPRKKTEMSVTTADYGTTADGQAVTEYTCQNAHGMVMKMINYGATMTSLEVCDKDGNYDNIILGFDSLEGYENGTSYFGCTVGRFCNRIAGGKFTIDGTEYELAINNPPNHLHGGDVGFNRVVWDAKPIEEDDLVGVEFTMTSPDGDEGYPGNVTVVARYTISNSDRLTMQFEATTDAPTHVNLTNHNYWNLRGAGSGTILDHDLRIDAPLYLEVDDTLIPTGELLQVNGTPLDFTTMRKIGEQIEQVQIGENPKGYDHCYHIVDPQKPAVAASLSDAESGREMMVATSLPGLQFYTGNFLDGSEGSGGFEQYGALCLETQLFPDSPNQSDKVGFTNSLLMPGRTFRATTYHDFFSR